MNKFLASALLLFAMQGLAQTNYFTAYNFTVEPQNVGAVYSLVDDYYKAHKPEGVSVWLYENHFNDPGNNHTHSLVFSGTQQALGGMYDGGQSEAFQLFLTRVNTLIKDGNSSVSGTVMDGYGADDGPYPFRQLFLLNVSDPEAFAASFGKFNTANNPAGRMVTMGGITMGRSPHGETHFVLVGFKSMTAALAGSRGLVPDSGKAAYDKAWDAHMEAVGDFTVVRNSLMMVLGEW